MNRDASQQSHSVCIYDCARAELSGIAEVKSFHDEEILLLSSFGEISVEGECLKIDSFSVETGRISIAGKITGLLYYEKNSAAKSGIFSRRGAK